MCSWGGDTCTAAYPLGPRKFSHSFAMSVHFHSKRCTKAVRGACETTRVTYEVKRNSAARDPFILIIFVFDGSQGLVCDEREVSRLYMKLVPSGPG